MQPIYRAPQGAVKDDRTQTDAYAHAFAWDPELAAAVREEIERGLPPGSLRGAVVDARKRAGLDAIKAGRETLAVLSGSHTISDISPVSAAEGTQSRVVSRRQAFPSNPHSAPQGRTRGRAPVAVCMAGEAPAPRVLPSITPESFPGVLPAKPYCTDDPSLGLDIRRRSTALKMKSIQVNHMTGRVVALILDIDRPDAATAWMDAGLPQPNLIVVNPENGHAHTYYFLRAPVLAFEKSASKPQAFFEAIQRGYIRRLSADPGYSGMMAKNPLHGHWRAIWGRPEPFTLDELDAPLDFEDKAPVSRVELQMGFGRNSTTFDTVRKSAYLDCLRFKVGGGTLEGWQDRIVGWCAEVNARFESPLSAAEQRHIAKSIAKWTWKKFNVAEHSARQRQRVMRRWEGHEKTEPWKAYGMSERTYYRRKKAGTLPEPIAQPLAAPHLRIAA